MHNWVRIATAALLPPVALAESFAWFGLMTMFFLYATDDPSAGGLGLEMTRAGTMYTVIRIGTLVAMLLAGLVAIGVGGHFVLVLGLVTLASGLAGVGLATEATLIPVMIVLVLGVGGYRVGLFSVAARPFGHPRGHLRDALFVGLWAVFNAGALAGPLVHRTTVYWGWNHRVVLHLLGGVALVAALLATVLGLVVLKARSEPPEPGDSGRRFSGKRLAAVVGLIAVCVVPWGSYGGLGMLQHDAIWELEAVVSAEMLYAINPALILLISVVLVPLLVILHVARIQVPAFVPIGVGLVLFGLGVAVYAAGLPVDAFVAFVVATVLMTAGEMLLGPFLLSRVAGDAHWRLAPLLVAAWLTGSGLMSMAASAVTVHEAFRSPAGWVVAAMAVLGGLLLLAIAWPLRGVFVVASPAEVSGDGPPAEVDRWQTEQFGV